MHKVVIATLAWTLVDVVLSQTVLRDWYVLVLENLNDSRGLFYGLQSVLQATYYMLGG